MDGHYCMESHKWAPLPNTGNLCYANALIKGIAACSTFFTHVANVAAAGVEVKTGSPTEVGKSSVPKGGSGANVQQTKEEKVIEIAKSLKNTFGAIGSGDKIAAREAMIKLNSLTIEESKVGSQEDPTEFAGTAYGSLLNTVSSFTKHEYNICSNKDCPMNGQQVGRKPVQEQGFLYLPISRKMDLFKDLGSHVMSTKDGLKCEFCGVYSRAIKCSRVDEPPELLPIVFQRNVMDPMALRKRVPVPSTGTFSGVPYDLVSAISHGGATADAGHYWAHIVERNGTVTQHDDERIVPNRNINPEEVYVLFYERRQMTSRSRSSADSRLKNVESKKDQRSTEEIEIPKPAASFSAGTNGKWRIALEAGTTVRTNSPAEICKQKLQGTLIEKDGKKSAKNLESGSTKNDGGDGVGASKLSARIDPQMPSGNSGEVANAGAKKLDGGGGVGASKPSAPIDPQMPRGNSGEVANAGAKKLDGGGGVGASKPSAPIDPQMPRGNSGEVANAGAKKLDGGGGVGASKPSAPIDPQMPRGNSGEVTNAGAKKLDGGGGVGASEQSAPIDPQMPRGNSGEVANAGAKKLNGGGGVGASKLSAPIDPQMPRGNSGEVTNAGAKKLNGGGGVGASEQSAPIDPQMPMGNSGEMANAGAKNLDGGGDVSGSKDDKEWLLKQQGKFVYARYHYSDRRCDSFFVGSNVKKRYKCRLCHVVQKLGVPLFVCKKHLDYALCASCTRNLADDAKQDLTLVGDFEMTVEMRVGLDNLIRVSTNRAWLTTTDVAVGIQFVLYGFYPTVMPIGVVFPHNAKFVTRDLRFHICPQFQDQHHMLWIFGCDENGERTFWWFDSLLPSFSGEARFKELEAPLNIKKSIRLGGRPQKDDYSCGLFAIWAAGIISNVICQNQKKTCAEITPLLQESLAQAKFSPENVRAYLQYSLLGLKKTHAAIDVLVEQSVGPTSPKIGDTPIAKLFPDDNKEWWFSPQKDPQVRAPAVNNGQNPDIPAGGADPDQVSEKPDLATNNDENPEILTDPSEDLGKPSSITSSGQIVSGDTIDSSKVVTRMYDPALMDLETSTKGKRILNSSSGPLQMPFPIPCEPPDCANSKYCLNALLKNIELFEIEKYRPLADNLLEFYKAWVENLESEDYKKFTSVLVNTHERLLFDGREMSAASGIKFPVGQKGQRSGKLRARDFACTCRYEAERKLIGGIDGIQQRNRESCKTNCKRTARVSSKLTFSHEHNCKPIVLGANFQTVRGAKKKISSEDEKAILSRLRDLIFLGSSYRVLRTAVFDSFDSLGIKGDLHLGNNFIKIAKDQVAKQTNTNGAVNDFMDYLSRMDPSQRRMNDPEVILVDGEDVTDRRVVFLKGAAFREADWMHPRHFFMFFVDGTEKLVLGDYTCIPIFGLAQNLMLKLIAFIVATSESRDAFDLGLQVLSDADRSLWHRSTIWMSDESPGLISALGGRHNGRVDHLFCLLHKAANVEMKSGVVDNAATDTREPVVNMDKFERELLEARARVGRVRARAQLLPNRKKLPIVPMEKRKFSTWLNCFACPSSDEPEWTCWLSYIRAAPTREEMLVRLDEFRSEAKVKSSYILSLCRNAHRWALCEKKPSPDLGFGTNNVTESAINRLKQFVDPNLPLSQLPQQLNKFKNLREFATILTKDGKSSSTLPSLRKRLSPVFSTLIEHFEAAKITSAAEVRILENAEQARGFRASLTSMYLTRRDRINSWEQSAFALRFIQICDRLHSSPNREQLMSVKDNNGIKYFVLVLNNGSYLCSCGYTVQHAGLPCSHVLAAFEQGFLRFHAFRNLHMYYVRTARPDEEPDYTLVPSYIRNTDIPDVGQANCRSSAIVVTCFATWNPFDNPRLDAHAAPVTLVNVLQWLEQETPTPANVDPKRTRLEDNNHTENGANSPDSDEGSSDDDASDLGPSTTSSEANYQKPIDDREEASCEPIEDREEALSAPVDNTEDNRSSGRLSSVELSGSSLEKYVNSKTLRSKITLPTLEVPDHANESRMVETKEIRGRIDNNNDNRDELETMTEEATLLHMETVREMERHLRGIRNDPQELEEFKQAIMEYFQRCGLTTYHKMSSTLGYDALKRLLERCSKQGRADYVSSFAQPLLRAYRERNMSNQRDVLAVGKYVGLTPKRHSTKKRRGSSPLDRFVGKAFPRKGFKAGARNNFTFAIDRSRKRNRILET